MQNVTIGDCGCLVRLKINDEGNIKVVDDGGCGVAEVLGDSVFYSGEDWREELGQEIIEQWVEGYEGGESAARENGLYVDVDGVRTNA